MKTNELLLKEATLLSSLGLCVLPSSKKRKCPLVSWTQHQNQRPTEDELIQMFTNKVDAISLVCGSISGNLEVLDFDNGDEQYKEFLVLLEAHSPKLSKRLVSEKSQSGGYHIFYKCEQKVERSQKLATKNKKILIETKGEGGLITCSPTEGYKLIQGLLTEIPLITIEERNLLISFAKSLNEDVSDKVWEKIPNSSENKYYDLLPGTDFNERGDIRPILIEAGWQLTKSGENEYWCRPDKDSGVSATFKNGIFFVFSSNAVPFESNKAYSIFHVFTLLKCNGDFTKASKGLFELGYGKRKTILPNAFDFCNEGLELEDPGLIPEHLLIVPGFIGELSSHMYKNAPYPNKVMAFLGALSMQSFLCGRLIKSERDLRPNLYILGLGFSSSGKDYPRKINTLLLKELNKLDCLGDNIASAEGIEDKLELQPCLLYQTDEIDSMLSAIKNGGKEIRYANIMSFLLKVYSASSNCLPRRTLANMQYRPPIIEPHLTIFGTATPINFYEALSEKMLTNGFFGRMLVFEGYPKESFNTAEVEGEIPNTILDIANYWVSLSSQNGNLKTTTPKLMRSNEASKTLNLMFAKKVDAEYKKCEELQDPIGTTVWGRAIENSIKLAMLYSVSKDPKSFIIDEEATKWSIDIVSHLVKKMLFMASKYSSDSKSNKDMMRILDMIPNTSKGISRSALLKKSKLAKKDFDLLIETLLERGDIISEEFSSSTNKGIVYKLAKNR